MYTTMSTTSKHNVYPVIAFADSKAFEKWLVKNHSKEDGLWLKIAKIKSGIKSVSYLEALDVALCYGWIDGLRRGLDEEYFIQKFTPRRTNSLWSVVNKKKVAALIKSGRMQAPGIDAINMAKKNGRWKNAYDPQGMITISPELKKALNKNPKAKAFFGKLTSQNRYAILFRIHNAKKEETKNKKIEEYVAMLEKHETIYPQSSMLQIP